jgi:hypothetical protein
MYFQSKNPNLGKYLEGLAMEDVAIFYVHFVFFTALWYILWPFRIIYGHLVYYFSRSGMLYQEKSGSPELNPLHLFFRQAFNIGKVKMYFIVLLTGTNDAAKSSSKRGPNLINLLMRRDSSS